MKVYDGKLLKYKKIKHFIYDTDNKDGGMFAIPGMLGLMFNALFGTIFLIVDIVVITNTIVPIIFLTLNVLMVTIPYFYGKKYSKDGSYTYSFFLPGLYVGLSGVYSSIVFLYLTHELLYSAMGNNIFIKSYMTVVAFIYFVIVLIQCIWYFVALKIGYYSDDYYGRIAIRKRMDTIAKVLFYPVGILFIAIAPFTYILTRIIVHTVDSYP